MVDKQKLELKIPEGCHGHDLQELMYVFVNWFSRANEKRDNIAEKLSSCKLMLEHIESEALKKVLSESGDVKMTSDIRKAHMFTTEVEISGKTINIHEQKKAILSKQYELSRIESAVKELERLINVCQSSLSYDRQEAGMPQR